MDDRNFSDLRFVFFDEGADCTSSTGPGAVNDFSQSVPAASAVRWQSGIAKLSQPV